MKQKYLFFILISSSISCGWLQEEPLTEDHPVVRAAAEKKLDNFIKIKIERCRKDMMEKAEAKVDSVIAEYYEDYIEDTTYFPAMPKRPEFPEKIIADSTLRPIPIFDSIPLPDSSKMKVDSISKDQK